MKAQQLPQWTASADAGLSQVLNGDRDELKAQVETGIAQLWYLPDVDSWMITRVEHDQNPAPVLVICCYQGKDLNTVGVDIVNKAKKQGFAGICYHTQRQGLNRLLTPLGFELMESIFYTSLTPSEI